MVQTVQLQDFEVVNLGLTDYAKVFSAMQQFTERRNADTPDELWFTQHHAVFTQGQAGRAEHLLAPGDIQVVQSDRGGQVTYHGPGQLVAYLLFDITRRGLGPRGLVRSIEAALCSLLARYGISATTRDDAPGVYVDGAKIASLGLRIRRGCSYHGLSLNVDMDLEPFQRINPCGLVGVGVTRMSDLSEDVELARVQLELQQELTTLFADPGD